MLPPNGIIFDLEAYPNPFNGSLIIEFHISERPGVCLEAFNLLGQRVAVLADGVCIKERTKSRWMHHNGHQACALFEPLGQVFVVSACGLGKVAGWLGRNQYPHSCCYCWEPITRSRHADLCCLTASKVEIETLNMLRPRVHGLFRLFRFELPFTAGVCVILGEVLALGRLPSVLEMVLGFLSFFFVSATALILNDYFDIETDRVNAPQRPLPSGIVTKRDVLLLSIAVALLSFLTSYLISMQALCVVLLVWVAGFFTIGGLSGRVF